MEKLLVESEEPRYERKFVFRGSSLQEIQQFIRLHPAHFQVLYPDRYINNIYFDTFNFSRYREQLAGVSKRSKLRLRWYGDRFGRSPARLERKCREGFVNWKEIVEINDFQFKETGALSQVYNEPLLTQFKKELQLVEPKFLNRYLRSYFISSDKKFRVTVDRDLHFSLISSPERIIEKSELIVELKYQAEDDHDADMISDYFPYRVDRCTKFGLGIESLCL